MTGLAHNKPDIVRLLGRESLSGLLRDAAKTGLGEGRRKDDRRVVEVELSAGLQLCDRDKALLELHPINVRVVALEEAPVRQVDEVTEIGPGCQRFDAHVRR